MSYNIEVTSYFAKQLKRLAKKFPSLKKEYAELIASLKENPEQALILVTTATKYALPLLQSKKEKAVVLG